MIPSDLGPEASRVCISPMLRRENSSGTLPYPSLSKIPLPKCLVESSVRIGRSRNELRNTNLSGVEPSKVGIWKPDSQENDLSLLYSKSEPRALFTATRMRGTGDVTVQAALTPISVNAFSAIDGQDGGSMTDRTTQNTSASQFQQSTNPSRLSQSTSTSKTPNKNDFREWVENGVSRELNTGQTLVWSNAVFQADRSNGEQSPCIESNASINFSPNSSPAVSNETPCVSGAIPSLLTRNTGVVDLSSSRFILCGHGGEMLSPEELPSTCERSNTVTLVESPRLSTSGVLAGDSTFIKISNNGSYLGKDADFTMNSFPDCDSSDEKHRTGSMFMELENAPLGSDDIKCGLRQDQPLDLMSTKKNLFDASLLEEEDFDLVTFQPISVTDTDMANSLSAQYREELHTADRSSMSANFEDATEPENLYVVHDCREFRKDQSQFQAALFHHALAHSTKESLDAQLEDDIQRDIEDEISKEILNLSQKLANLQARHGAQRMLDGSLPAVLSCPVTPVLTPRIRHRKADVICSKKQDGIGDYGCRQKRGRVVAAKVFQGNVNRTSESGTTSEKVQQSKPIYDQVCAGALNVQKLVMGNESLGRRCSSSNSNSATHRCAHSSKKRQQGAQEEQWSHHGDDSLAGTPSSGSIRSNVTDYTLTEPKVRTLHVGVTSPQVFPDNNRRFEWVKTLRSGETGIRGSPGTVVSSKQPLKMPTPRKQVGEDSESESKIRLDSAKKKRETLLEDMTRVLETRLNELAIRTTLASAQIPAVQHMQGTRNVGRVVASRYASCSEPRVDKHPEGSKQKDASEDYGCLDRRTAVHLMKAGLTRGLAGKKQSPYGKSKVVKSEKHDEKIITRKSVGIQYGNTDPSQPFLDKHSSHDQPEQTPHTWSEMKETIETEYETFVEGPNDDPTISDIQNVTKNLQEQTAGEEAAIKSSQGSTGTAEEGSTVLSTSRGSALRSKIKRQPIKSTYIRCIEVVLDQPLVDRLASTANQSLSTTQSRIPDPNEKIKLGVLEGSLPPSSKSTADASDDNHPNMADASHFSTVSLHEKLDTSSKIEGSKSSKTRNQPLRTVFKLHRNTRPEEGYVQDMSPGPCDLQVPSGDGEGQTKATAAEKPLLSSLKERWEELIDVLEKERLRLPKIRTETENMIGSSPRDSGSVKRITERLKSMEHFNPENLIPNGLQGRSDDQLIEGNLGVASELIKSCDENAPNCTKTIRSTTPTQRPLQFNRKGAPQLQTKLTRRQWKLPQLMKNDDNQQKSRKSIGNCRKFSTDKSPTSQTDIESFDLESFWCLVRESDDYVQTTLPPSAAVR